MSKSSDAVHAGLLECKGSKYPRNALRQLASAYEQLGGILVAGRPVRGLAVSATVADRRVSYSAVQRFPPPPDDARDRLQATEIPAEWLESFFPEQHPVPDFDSSLQVEEIVRGPGRDTDSEGFTATALAASWSILADFSANDDAFERWAAPSRIRRARDVRRQRREFADRGLRIRGTSNIITLPGGQLEAVLGVLDYVDDALTFGDSADITRAQARAKSQVEADVDVRSRAARLDGNEQEDEPVTALGPDGSVLVLRQA